MRVFVALWLFLLAPAASAGNLACLEGMRPVVGKRAVGVQNLHREGDKTITGFMPLPLERRGGVLNLNQLGFSSRYPLRFALSDGTLRTAFISVDLRAGSRLDLCLAELEEILRLRAPTEEAALEMLRTFLGGFLQPLPKGFRFAWDPPAEVALPPEFAAAAELPPGHAPLPSTLTHNIVPLEAFLREGRGVCVQKALLASLLLGRLGIEHRLRAGGSAKSGHMWIELEDGRVLDPTWELLLAPRPEAKRPGWFRLDRTALFIDEFFPLVVD